jgi:hypothetical protein
MLDEGEKSELREIMLVRVEESRRKICNVVTESAEIPNAEEFCWGCLTDNEVSFEAAMVAEAVVVALHEEADHPISPYRAEVLVERMQCNKIVTDESRWLRV